MPMNDAPPVNATVFAPVNGLNKYQSASVRPVAPFAIVMPEFVIDTPPYVTAVGRFVPLNATSKSRFPSVPHVCDQLAGFNPPLVTLSKAITVLRLFWPVVHGCPTKRRRCEMALLT